MSPRPTVAPGPPAYGPDAALIVVDYQNDFVSPRGSLRVAGAEALLPGLEREIARAQAQGALVAYSQDWHPPHTPHFAQDGGVWPVHCVKESWGARLYPGLPVVGPVLRKGTGGEDGYSAFSQREQASGERRATGLETLLRSHGIRRVYLAGVATDYCVKETALDALRLGFETHVLGGLVRPVDVSPGDGARALALVERAGAKVLDRTDVEGPAHELGGG